MVRVGANRIVFLLGPFAFKLPRATSWRALLFGLLNNGTEARRGKRGQVGYCPVLFSLPGGWLVVQKRAEPLTVAEWQQFDPEFFIALHHLKGVEHKPCSFGRIGFRIVAVDYGWI